MVGTRLNLVDAPIEKCVHSRFNTRKTRSEEHIQRLAERITRNGFERTRSLWGIPRDDCFEIFAGGTRLEAASRAGLATVPVFLFEKIADEQIARKADEDNANDEYHLPVPLPDVWMECHRLWKEEGWTQQQIADAKGWSKTTVSKRIAWHMELPQSVKQQCCDGVFDEGHCDAISAACCDVATLNPWLTTERVQEELVAEVLKKHVGTSVGVKPTVKRVREAARRWTSLIGSAKEAYAKLPEGGPWREQFVRQLAEAKARSESAVNTAFSKTLSALRRHEQDAADRLRVEADAKAKEALRLEQEERRRQYVQSQTAKLHLGDARQLIDRAPDGFHLLLTDPPYGVDFQSNRRVASAKKEKLQGDACIEDASALLREVLAKAYPKMAPHAHVLIFSSWRHEPRFRLIIEDAGFTIKGSLVWVKANHGSGDVHGAFAPKHERIIHAVKGRPPLSRRLADVFTDNDRPLSEHPAEKPQSLLRQLIEVTSSTGDVAVDPFMGSGATMLAAFDLSRDFFGVEVDPAWHAVAQDAMHRKAEGCLE